MNKEDLLKNIVESGYNVGYAAKKHFATYDIASKAPGAISVLSTAVGVFGLIVDYPSKKFLSATFLVFGLIALRINVWDHKKEDYSEAGRKITDVFNKLKSLYYNTKTAADDQLPLLEKQLEDLQKEFGQMGKSGQMMFSDWYAHYKFFWQQQIGWLEEQKKFSFWRDKIPLTLIFIVTLLVLAVCIFVVSHIL